MDYWSCGCLICFSCDGTSSFVLLLPSCKPGVIHSCMVTRALCFGIILKTIVFQASNMSDILWSCLFFTWGFVAVFFICRGLITVGWWYWRRRRSSVAPSTENSWQPTFCRNSWNLCIVVHPWATFVHNQLRKCCTDEKVHKLTFGLIALDWYLPRNIRLRFFTFYAKAIVVLWTKFQDKILCSWKEYSRAPEGP